LFQLENLKELDDKFAELLQHEEHFPPKLLDMETLYANFYTEMTLFFCATT